MAKIQIISAKLLITCTLSIHVKKIYYTNCLSVSYRLPKKVKLFKITRQIYRIIGFAAFSIHVPYKKKTN